ncbi:MAG: hypothetical protein ACREQ4_03295 [Candidatus Binataceae bacterium]
MNPANTYQQQLRDEIAAVEKEIDSHNQQVELFNKRLEGLRRALELFDSEHSAISELLRTAGVDGEIDQPAGFKAGKFASNPKGQARRRQTSAGHQGSGAGQAHPQRGTGKADTTPRLKRVDMIAAALKRHPRLSVRELIAALDQQFKWKTSESAVTAHLYTNPGRFVHTKADPVSKRPVVWSLK